jgi:hypothetical protein
MKIRYSFFATGVLALTLLTMLSACEVNDQASLTNGIFKVQLTGAPGDYEAVYIDIRDIRIKSKNLYHDDLSDDEDEKHKDNEGWTTINDDSVRINLVDYQNGKSIQVGNEELEAGVYDELRFFLGSDNAVIVNGESHELKIPSAQQSGIPLQIDAEIRDGETYNLLIDLDAGQSIVKAEGGKYILNPVMSAKNLD